MGLTMSGPGTDEGVCGGTCCGSSRYNRQHRRSTKIYPWRDELLMEDDSSTSMDDVSETELEKLSDVYSPVPGIMPLSLARRRTNSAGAMDEFETDGELPPRTKLNMRFSTNNEAGFVFQKKLAHRRRESTVVSHARLHSKVFSNATVKMFDTALKKHLELPPLEGFLMKKVKNRKKWHRRWLLVANGTHLLWSKERRECENPLDMNERRKFNNCVTIMQITQVLEDSKDPYKTTFIIKTPLRDFTFRAENTLQRNRWIDGLQMYVQALDSKMQCISPALFPVHSQRKMLDRRDSV